MKYISTRGGIAPVSFDQAVMMGLARDGGLLLFTAIF
jgi:threonine synthase